MVEQYLIVAEESLVTAPDPLVSFARKALERGLDGVAGGTPFLTAFLGVTPRCDGETTSFEFEIEPQFCNRRGGLHGGIISLLFDIVMSNHHRFAQGPGATIELKVQYLRAVTAGTIRAEARFLRRGKRLSFVEGRIVDATGTLIAAATGTWARIEMPENTPNTIAEPSAAL